MTKRNIVRAVSCSVFALALVAALCIMYSREVSDREMRQCNAYGSALAGLSDALCDMSGSLSKAMYTQTPYRAVELAAEISESSAYAKQAVDGLPLEEDAKSEFSKFLSQTGDFVLAMSKKRVGGEVLTDSEKRSLSALAIKAEELDCEISALLAQAEDEAPNSGEFEELVRSCITFSSEQTVAVFGENEAPQGAKLIYDGPFSDSMFSAASAFLENKDEISEDEAKQRAAYFLDIKQELLQPVCEIKSESTKCYCFSYKNCDVLITKNGGYLHSMSILRDVSSATLKADEAIQKAKNFLSRAGYTDMKESFYQITSNIMTVNFAYTDSDVTVYTDLIKVGIALDTGETVFADASGFLSNHTDLEFTVTVSQAQAAEQLDRDVTKTEEGRLAVIPSSGNIPLLCWEFLCKDAQGQRVLVYINAENGREEDCLILIDDNGGTLVI